jgi:hypothetical protein
MSNNLNLIPTAVVVSIIIIFVCYCGALCEIERVKRKDAE